MDVLRSQLRYAIRSIRRTPVVSAVVVTTLSVSIALVTTFFGFVNSAFFHPLPYPDAARTISLSHSYNIKIEVDELARTSRALQSVATFSEAWGILTYGGVSTEVVTVRVDTALFPMLKVSPIVGSLPTRAELRSAAPLAVIGERLWRGRFGSRTDIIGVPISINGVQRRVVGVMPAWFTFPFNGEAWYPFDINELGPTETVSAIARLADGASFGDAAREASLIRPRLIAADSSYRKIRWGYFALSPHMVSRLDRFNAAPLIWLVVGGAVCVLLVACTNIAALMLAREARRRGETIIRASLGATAWQIVQQHIIESVVLACVSGTIGIVLSVWFTRLSLGLLPTELGSWLPGWVHLGLDSRVFVFALGVSLLTVALFAVWPAREAIRLDLTAALRSSADRGVSGGDPMRRLHLPVTLQISLSVILLVAATTLVRSSREYGADRGYSTVGLTERWFTYNPSRDTSNTDFTRLHVRLGERMREIGGAIQVATVGRYRGLSDSAPRGDFEVRKASNRQLVPEAFAYPGAQMVSDNYFRVLGIRIVAGRAFGEEDPPGSPTSIIVSREFAKEVWGTADVLGKQLTIGKPSHYLTVIGIVENVRRAGIVNDRLGLVDGSDLYFSDRQVLTQRGSLSYMIRSPLTPAALVAFASRAAKSLGHDLSARALPMTVERGPELMNHLLADIIGAFAVICLLLATMGIYGVVAFSVEQRLREVGIRMALGAQASDVIRLLVVGGGKLVLIGTAIGLVGSAAAGKIVTSVVVASLGGHVTTAFVVAGVFVMVSGVACYLPARRSMRIDPVSLLRE